MVRGVGRGTAQTRIGCNCGSLPGAESGPWEEQLLYSAESYIPTERRPEDLRGVSRRSQGPLIGLERGRPALKGGRCWKAPFEDRALLGKVSMCTEGAFSLGALEGVLKRCCWGNVGCVQGVRQRN